MLFMSIALSVVALSSPLGSLLPSETVQTIQTDDPEASPNGRSVYLGRDVARTMHWRGAPWLLRETRENEENGALLREWLDVRPGDAVCDLGCGNGYHTLPLVEAVGPKGKVFAVDLQPEMLELLDERAKERGLDSLVPVVATVDDPNLPEASCDLVLMVDVYHELSHPVRVLAHLRRALKPGGRVVLVEFRTEDRSVPIKTKHKMPKAQMIREMAANGFRMAAETDRLPWQHVMAFERSESTGPRHEARELARGLVAAASRTDARLLEPFFDADVTVNGERDSAKRTAIALGELMRDGAPLLPFGTRLQLEAGGANQVVARLSAPAGGSIAEDTTELELGVDDEGRWVVQSWGPPRARVRSHGARSPFVAMATGPRSQDGADGVRSAERLRALGFDGLATVQSATAADRVDAESSGLDVWATYAVLDLGSDVDGQLDEIESTMTALEGGPGMLWLAIQGPRDDANPGQMTGTLDRLQRHAERTNAHVALYPHTGFWLDTTERAVELAAGRERIGVCFNLCHYLKRKEAPSLTALMTSARSELVAVTLNGADVDGASWRELIQPLGSGTFQLAQLFDALDAVEFQGLIALQTYGLQGAPAAHLAASMTAWRAAQVSRKTAPR